MFDWLSPEYTEVGSAQEARLEKTGIVTQGLIAGTRVASNLGWRAAEALAPGDKVLTFDNGMQTVVEVRREVLWVDGQHVPEQHWPVKVPAGALCNRVELEIMPDQGVVVESDVADEAINDPFAVLHARDLVGLRGIQRVAPSAQLEVITLVFDTDEVVYAEGGALIHCPKTSDLLAGHDMAQEPRYVVLDADLSALVVDELRLEDALAQRALMAAA